nr:D-alanyl-D-alanine carboxypeptidase/D-alanyl-D-alanine-endopeptidase [Gemmatimonadaceae bacterium]
MRPLPDLLRPRGFGPVSAIAVAAALAACAPASATRPVTPAPVRGFVVPDRATLVAGIDSVVQSPEFRNAHWGILVVDPERGDTLYSHNAGKLFMPASNQKIVTGAVALARLGPDYRFRTAFAAGGPVADGTLHGDLLVMGSGDPSVSTSVHGDAMVPLRAVADSLYDRGLRRIDGTLRSARDAFPGDIYGFGWAFDDFDYAYSAPVDELMFNESFTRVTVRGTVPGQPPSVTIVPTARALRVQVEAITTSRGDSIASRVQYFGAATTPGDSIRNLVRLVGTINAGDSVSFNVAHRDPTGAYLDALAAALEARGISVRQPATNGAVAGTATRADTLFVLHSVPLRELLPVFEKPSQNQIGEVLLRTLGLQ